jgi:hypothetical protein
MTSCTKANYCLSCYVDCYYCKVKTQSFCADSFKASADFEAYTSFLIQSGDTCIAMKKSLGPPMTSQYEYCGDLPKATEVKKGYEDQNYKCTIS